MGTKLKPRPEVSTALDALPEPAQSAGSHADSRVLKCRRIPGFEVIVPITE